MPAPVPGPTSHVYFSQRLRLHYVDWGNDDAPSLIMLHGGLDHCRSWDWVAQELRESYHVVAPDLRGHGDSQWVLGAAYAPEDYVYDLAQLIHQKQLAPVRIIAHSLGGAIALRYAGIYPDTVRKLVTVEGLMPPLEWIAKRSGKPTAERMVEWVDMLREMAGRAPRRYPTIRRGRAADAGGQQAPHARAGAPPDRPRRQPERGRHLHLEVRQLRARLLPTALRRRGSAGAVEPRRLPDAPDRGQGQAAWGATARWRSASRCSRTRGC